MKIFLPLYSYKEKDVCPRSGLNQWNANGEGRPRNCYEVYIPIPAIFNKKYSSFFPDSDTSFQLIFPNGQEVSAKICQAGGKALMSNPNSGLGRWLLAEVLKIGHNGVIKYQDLIVVNYDSVEIEKIGDGRYTIKPAPLGSFENFIIR